MHSSTDAAPHTALHTRPHTSHDNCLCSTASRFSHSPTHTPAASHTSHIFPQPAISPAPPHFPCSLPPHHATPPDHVQHRVQGGYHERQGATDRCNAHPHKQQEAAGKVCIGGGGGGGGRVARGGGVLLGVWGWQGWHTLGCGRGQMISKPPQLQCVLRLGRLHRQRQHCTEVGVGPQHARPPPSHVAGIADLQRPLRLALLSLCLHSSC